MEFQLDLQTLVIDRSVETTAFVLVDLKTGADDRLAFLLINHSSFFFWRHFVFVGRNSRCGQVTNLFAH